MEQLWATSYQFQEGDSGKRYVVGEDRYTPEEMNEPSLAHLGLICLHLLCPAIWLPQLCLSVS